MAIEQTRGQAVRKPWGSRDLRPWATIPGDDAIGEIWFERAGVQPSEPALLFKLLFTEETLSIQVHPDDSFAQSLGMPNGKTEAWYILSAEPGAQLGVGLKRQVTREELRQAILDGSIADIVQWRNAAVGDMIFIPAGTIHAIGAGLVVAEVQQRSDTTFRLFDYGRGRELHVDQAVAASDPEPVKKQAAAVDLTNNRTQLLSCPFFVLERIDLPANSSWEMSTGSETWALVIAGDARFGSKPARIGDVFSADASRSRLDVGRNGLKALIAYVGSQAISGLLRDLDTPDAKPVSRNFAHAIVQRQSAVLPFRSMEARP